MRRRQRQKWLRRIGGAVGTLLVGTMLGFLVPTIVAEYSPKGDLEAPTPEAPIAHRFIEAFVADDQGTLTQLGMSADIKLRASRFRADFGRVDAPIHLGSYIGGGYSVHAYGIHVVRKDGTDDLLSWRVYTAGGQVGLIMPPSVIEPE